MGTAASRQNGYPRLYGVSAMMTGNADVWRYVADVLDPQPHPYAMRPAAFVHDMFDWTQVSSGAPTEYQDEILDAIPVKKKVSVRGPHGLGKTTLNAWAVHWFAATRDMKDWKVLTTASWWRQLTIYLWPEIHKWARLIRWDQMGRAPYSPATELLKRQLALTTGAATPVASSDPAAIEGAHADCLLYIFDESKEIEAGTFDAAEGAFSGAGADTVQEAFALATSTPGDPSGRFYDIHTRKPGTEDWWTRFVTLEECIKAGRVSRGWADLRKIQWGETSAVYQNRVLGEFATQAEDAVIPLAWIEAAVRRWEEFMRCLVLPPEDEEKSEMPEFTCVGVDVARSGNDKTTYARRFRHVIQGIDETALEDTEQTASRVMGVLRAYQNGYAYTDVIGVGGGVVDKLAHSEFADRSFAFNASAKSAFTDESGELGFINRRAEAWWNMRMLLDPSRQSNICLPPDDKLIGDLAAPRWKVSGLGGGVIQVESKEDIARRIGRSTDHADAVIHSFAPLPQNLEPQIVIYDEPVQISPL